MEDAGRWVLITNLKRPFTHIQLQAMLSSLTQVSYFRLNSVKSHCYIEVLNAEEADRLIEALQGKVWPETGLPLVLEKISREVCIPVEEKKGQMAEGRFRKTAAQPQIYWSPGGSGIEGKRKDESKSRPSAK